MTARLPVLLMFLALASPARSASRLEAAIDALRGDPSLKVRTQAAIILGQRGAPEAVAALRQAVAGDDSAAVRIAAVGALAKLRARAARPTLAAARASDPEEAVRSAAARALDALGPVTVHIEEPTGTPSVRAAARSSLSNCVRDLGLPVVEAGEIRLKPRVALEVDGGSRTVIAAKASVAVIDADGHLETMEGTARATAAGTLSGARLAATADKVVDAALRSVCQNLAEKLGRR